MTNAILLMGAPGSPYTRKMLGLLRYRRIPYRFILGTQRKPSDLPLPKVRLLPTFYFEKTDGSLEPVVDSTPIIRRLEQMFSGRAVIPPDPAVAFLDYLLEDYADEWLTKAMFHYRWHYDADIEKAGNTLPLYASAPLADGEHQRLKAEISRRQIERLDVVGSNPVTAPVIEGSYLRYLEIFENHLARGRFLFGNRPSAADFAAFGQLTQLAGFDPTPMALTARLAPRVLGWVETTEDLSGLEASDSDWASREMLATALRPFLGELGRTYVPVMLANAQAIADGALEVETEVEGRRWAQKPFPYQGKCVQWIGENFEALGPDDRAWVGECLAGTGCEKLLGRQARMLRNGAR